MKRTLTIRDGVDLDLLNKAVVAFGRLQGVLHGNTCYHTYLAQIRRCQEDGIPLSDIGTLEDEIQELCHTGSRNVIEMFAKLLKAGEEADLKDVVSNAEETITDEVRCEYVTRQDLEEFGLYKRFGVHLPAEGEG